MNAKNEIDNELFVAALGYAARGWPVLPLHSIRDGQCTCGKTGCASPGKHPRTRHGLKDATTDADTIRKWWTTWPDANVGIVTGAASGLVVLDVDPRHGGDVVLGELEAEHGPLPDTVECLTGGGGRHLYFKHPGGRIKSKAGVLGSGLDIKADGGYIVAPPSLHVSGRTYAWEAFSEPADVDVAQLPAWLLRLLQTGDVPRATRIDEGKDRIPQGQRNAALTSLAGTMRRRGISKPAIRAALLEENRLRCNPPLEQSEVERIAASVAKYTASDSVDSGGGTEKGLGENQATILVYLASKAELFHNPEGVAFVTIPNGSHRETWSIKSKGFRHWLVGLFWQTHKKVPYAQAMQDALGVLASKAVYEGPEQIVNVRLAEHDGTIWLDLADEGWQAVQITSAGWCVVADPPVKFLRPRGLLPLPQPIPGGRVDELRRFINLATDDDWILTVAWLVAALRPKGPYPLAVVNGEQGSAKSTFCRILKSLVDPNVAPLRTEPRSARDLMITATNSWVLALDNLSRILSWQSDAFCRLATGGGFATRELYSDNEEVLFDAMRPILINGIEELANRPDLLDRSLCLILPAIPRSARKTENELWSKFEQAKPRILGALMDVVSVGLRNVGKTKLSHLPRMADFAQWVTACESALPWPTGAFMKAYVENRDSTNDFAIEASPIGPVIQSFMGNRSEWSGTATELLKELDAIAAENVKHQRAWPKSAVKLSGYLRRVAPNLRQVGIIANFGLKSPDKKRRRLITLEKVGTTSSGASGPSGTTSAPTPPRKAPLLFPEAVPSPDDSDAPDGGIPTSPNGPLAEDSDEVAL